MIYLEGKLLPLTNCTYGVRGITSPLPSWQWLSALTHENKQLLCYLSRPSQSYAKDGLYSIDTICVLHECTAYTWLQCSSGDILNGTMPVTISFWLQDLEALKPHASQKIMFSEIVSLCYKNNKHQQHQQHLSGDCVGKILEIPGGTQ